MIQLDVRNCLLLTLNYVTLLIFQYSIFDKSDLKNIYFLTRKI